MNGLMSVSLKIRAAAALFAAVSIASMAYGQALPTATAAPSAGPGLPSIDGIFHYSLRGSELLQTGYRGSGVSYSTVLSGDASYSSPSVVRPFSMVYSGGLFLGNQYSDTVRTFQNFAVSQGLIRGLWSFGISDSVSYLPQSPTTGLSGIPGVGDIGSSPAQGPSEGPAGGVLTYNSTNVSNALTGSVSRRVTPLTSVSGSGSWSILRYPDGTGLENTQVSGQLGVSHQLDRRDTVSGSATYSTFSYGAGIDLSIQTEGVNAAFSRVLSHTLSVSASAGPMWISSSNKALIPSNLTVASNFNLSYAGETTSAALSYSRGVNGGSGVQPGAIADSVAFSAGRSYGRDWAGSLTANYTHSGGLLKQTAVIVGFPAGQFPFLYGGGNTNLAYGGAQVTRRISQTLSGYLSYNIQHQSIDNSLIFQNAFSGLSQTFGIGISFSPRSTRLGQF
jgi:hypothetical protein